MLNIKVSSEIFGSDKAAEKMPDIHLKLISEQVTLKEIIHRTVHEQIKQLQNDSVTQAQIEKRLRNQYLDNEDIAQLALDGKISYSSAKQTHPMPSVEDEVIRAINAFKRNKVKVFIDGEHISSLSDSHALYDGCVVNFIRLIPLVGG